MSLVKLKAQSSDQASNDALRASNETVREASSLVIPVTEIKPLIKTLVAEGVEVQSILRGTGLSPVDLARQNVPISYSSYLQLISNAQDLAPEPGFGIRLGKLLYANTDDTLSCRIMNSKNTAEAIKLMRDYKPLVTNIFHFNFEETDQYGVLTLQAEQPLGEALPFFIEYAFSAISCFIRFCLANHLTQLAYEFSFSDKPRERVYRDFFGRGVRFDQRENRILIPRAVLYAPFVFEDEQSAAINDEVCQNQVKRINQTLNIEERVKLLIRKRQFTAPSLEVVAKQLFMSPRTLRRQLQAQGATYKAILEEERKTLAVKNIEEALLPIEKVAERLGYQDASSFSRAFKRWFGVSPNHFNERQRQKA